MSEQKGGKLKKLISEWPHGAAYATSWLAERGISGALRQRYLSSGWIYSLGRGAVARTGDKVDWSGGLYAIQSQLHRKVHVGAKTALELQGFTHYLPLGSGQPVYLFGESALKLPSWFAKHDWDVELVFTTAELFSDDENTLLDHSVGDFAIKVSCPERAILELLHLVPTKQTPDEAIHLVEGLTNLRPRYIQRLLENCRSNKVKRTFLFLAERTNHSWFQRLDLSKIELGSGTRAIVKGGKYVKKYDISVPESWLSEAG